MEKIKVIISGGGTGGHVFPAIAIANALKAEVSDSEILFVGADNRLEMQKVPQSGYKIIGLPIRGLQRKLSFKMFDTFIRLLKSLRKSKQIIKEFSPDVVIGVGGYASAAVMRVASKKKIPTLIQEQNSFPGITNKLLAKKVSAICVAYEGLEQFFPSEKIHLTGNPIRNMQSAKETKAEALKYFNLKADTKTILITGGSLGAATLNQSIIKNIEIIINSDVQLIWQTGKRYYQKSKEFYDKLPKTDNIHITEFLDRMDLAYKAADLVVARAGAITISELSVLKKSVIFVPSPNVAEDHQTKNAEALVKKNAAILIKDVEAEQKLVDTFIKVSNNEQKLVELSENIAKFAKPDAANTIVKVILSLR